MGKIYRICLGVMGILEGVINFVGRGFYRGGDNQSFEGKKLDMFEEERVKLGEKKIIGRGRVVENNIVCLGNGRKFKIDKGRGSDRRGKQIRIV